jgi:hypothetical protein
MADLCAGYSAQELTVIREFIAGVQRVVYDQVRTLRDTGRDPKPATGPP